MNSDELANQRKKRKRTKNTSMQQYEIYHTFMEEDYYFRSGTINPTLGENYIENKWKDLCTKLNAVGEGPNLSVEIWKKRFMDWKYAVRSKYRKLSEYRKRTGSGPQSDIKLTPIEDRALGVWGTIVVTGTPCVSNYDGISITVPSTSDYLDLSNIPIINDDQIIINVPTTFEMTSQEIETQMPVVTVNANDSGNIETPQIPGETIRTNGNRNDESTACASNKSNNSRSNGGRNKPLSFLIEKLLESSVKCEQNTQNLIEIFKKFRDDLIKVKSEKNELEAVKIHFEIAKYKFENPTFSFDY